MTSTLRQINFFLFLVIVLNAAFWLGSRHIYPKWDGVPPAPTMEGAMMMTMGDASLSYRLGASTLQALGDGGGQTTSLRDYDYAALQKWFWLLNDIDPASNHVPMVAAYYFGATTVPKDAAKVVEYLAAIGQNPAGNKWRWLAQAVFMARYRMSDLDLALDLAYKLSRMQPIGDRLPIWAQQMPAYILKEQGDPDTARAIAEGLLTGTEKLHPNEINYLKAYLVETLGVSQEDVDALIAKHGQAQMDENVQETLPAPMPEQ